MPGGRLWEPHEEQFLGDSYLNHTQQEMAVQLGRTHAAVNHKVSRLGLIKSSQGAGYGNQNARRHQVDQTYFRRIDTPEKAYWLGFLFADGTVTDKALIVGLSVKDRDQLVRLKTVLRANHPITARTIPAFEKHYEVVRLTVYSKQLVRDTQILEPHPNYHL